MPTPFDALDDFIALPRVEGLALSPDGATAVLTVAALKKDATGYERSLWAVPTRGEGAPRRLTRSAKGESGAAFTPTGDILFVSARDDIESDVDDEPGQLWLLPAQGGEARPVTRLAGGVSGIAATAERTGRVIVSAPLLRSATSIEDDAARRAARTKKKVSAILHDTYPVRFWDHDLGPAEPHLLAVDLEGLADTLAAAVEDSATEEAEAVAHVAAAEAEPTPYPTTLPRPTDLLPEPGRALRHAEAALSPDGSTLVVSLDRPEARGGRRILVSVDVATGAHTVLRDEDGFDIEMPAISQDGMRLAFLRTAVTTPEGPTDQELWVSRLDGSDARRVAADWDRWPSSIAFAATDDALIVTADDNGRGPIFRVPLGEAGGGVSPIVSDDFTYSHVRVDHSGDGLVALRSSWLVPPHPVRIDPSGEVAPLATPAPAPAAPARIAEVETTADDGARVRSWLVLPEGASPDAPAPLLLWIHGGPLNSWNAWSWRWAPLLAAARGYAVLLPDPALSTGYGLDFIARGWNSWGGKPYTDLMAITDAAVARGDIDETRTAAMGGSFGGYMANWVAGHTDRFRAIVTHASLWALDQFAGTTDSSDYWQRIFTPEAMIEHSPHRFVADIRTPVLVVHGDRDYRVPIGEGLRLWSDLAEHHADADGRMPHRFLYFPDENHWVLKPQHAVVWYETVFAFLAEHVLGEEAAPPAVLG
ncbi:dipeptidyl aminopeptidase/acylaminoacyl peptidase [Microbacterium sp. AK009]|uniref:S9 family peptidase n=1 Tax=Microbacterium sp. AK009 TaxID=2723068 RepID=UPI0015CD4C63|nr:alpha/beta fold hydrolase [Microbacterium sp. AK009]NYF17878.1 dipeptidyl aminopeptidase/acylaminoacyl peptidase [Microbacterium sp. AK009]